MTATGENLSTFIEYCILYCLDVDVIVPPIQAMKEITLNEAMAYNLQSTLSANKRLGFKFQNEVSDSAKIESNEEPEK